MKERANLQSVPRLSEAEVVDAIFQGKWRKFILALYSTSLFVSVSSGDRVTGPTAALVRYREHGEVPMHKHKGYEHILILTGSQRDGTGIFKAGTLVINPPGTRHTVHSDAGCIVLAIYEKPVEFVEGL
jgi:quercetin dioxygenase-like cupin family protein